jgi:hypothetical protein
VTPGAEGRQANFDDELRRVVARSDPVPESVLSRAREAGRVGIPEGSTLLDLEHDSIVDEPVSPRPDEGSRRVLTFASDEIRVEICVLATTNGLKLSGTTAPYSPAHVSLRTEHTVEPVAVESDGSFIFSSVTRVPTSILLDVETDELRAFHTSWFLP